MYIHYSSSIQYESVWIRYVNRGKIRQFSCDTVDPLVPKNHIA